MKRIIPAVVIFAAVIVLLASLIPASPALACVGRTIVVGYFDSPDQVVVANLLSVFIDERTGTTVQLQKFASRDEALTALKADKISLYADYANVILAKVLGGKPGADEAGTLLSLKDGLSRQHNVVWLAQVGYDRYFSEKAKAGDAPGQTGVMLCKDALSKFPALPKLIAKLSGVLDNGTMERLVAESKAEEPKSVARRFLKSKKLV